ncbi:hypothetical protein GO009_02160 [Muricauda sp. TY007]|uniref:hypothetical protein n=1 Tax=Allomuricauda sp. TY007 TaxID=2683200 RepID=UPI0013C246E0|nr:hypothetical protein [Muricauda sp. TY007]NDV14815.1 hypothetical protein [Muricauda sp. TY007]
MNSPPFDYAQGPAGMTLELENQERTSDFVHRTSDIKFRNKQLNNRITQKQNRQKTRRHSGGMFQNLF